MSSYGLLIKLADRLDNVSDISCDNELGKKYSEQTKTLMLSAEKRTDLTNNHLSIISKIK